MRADRGATRWTGSGNDRIPDVCRSPRPEPDARVRGGARRMVRDADRRRQEAELVIGARVTWQYFRTVGLTPAIGRDFERAEDQPSRNSVVIISDSLWRRRYGADPNIVGR